MTDQLDKLHGMLKGFSTAMLVTHDGTSSLRARPMAIADIENSCALYFITSRESAKVHEIERDTRVTVICQKEHSAYLSLSGVARVEDDHSLIHKLWKEPYRVWFPKGKEDPEICAIHVEPTEAEYWNNQGFQKVEYLVKSMGAYLSGTTPKIREGEEHGRVKL